MKHEVIDYSNSEVFRKILSRLMILVHVYWETGGGERTPFSYILGEI